MKSIGELTVSARLQMMTNQCKDLLDAGVVTFQGRHRVLFMCNNQTYDDCRARLLHAAT